jgi:hypothetical protein
VSPTTNAPAALPRSAWCAYELYIALVSGLVGFEHHVSTAVRFFEVRKDKKREYFDGVCLLDGFAKRDEDFPARKVTREAYFPRELLVKSRDFSLDKAEASSPADLEAIKQAVGSDRAALEATLRVRFSLRRLTTLLLQEYSPTSSIELETLLADLRASQLRSLSLLFQGRKLEQARALLLAQALPPTVAKLNLHSGLAACAHTPLRTGQLLSLSLDSCDIGCVEMVELAASLAQSGGRLQVLSLFGNKLGADCGTAVAEALPHLPKLQGLYLGGNQLGSKGGTAVAEALPHLPELQRLYLDGTQLGAECGTALAEALPHLPELQVLHLGGNQLGAKGGTAVAEALPHLRKLQSLYLGGNQLGSRGGTAVAESLPHLPELQMLDLSSNRLGAKFGKAVAEALPHLPELQTLNLNYNFYRGLHFWTRARLSSVWASRPCREENGLRIMPVPGTAFIEYVVFSMLPGSVVVLVAVVIYAIRRALRAGAPA